MKKIILFTFIGLFLFVPGISSARDVISDWYIKDFQSEILVNKDSSLLITEKIIADCGKLPDKHGIFRVLPTIINIGNEKISNPIKLISITDFWNNPLEYSTIKSSGTITWKIGDPNKTVSGENYYKIIYQVDNAVHFGSSEFDELYWNVLGNFWDLEIDHFAVRIFFPEEVNKNNAAIEYYTGYVDQKGKDLATYEWLDQNILQVVSTQPLLKKQGVTVSVTFPKNIFTPYIPSASEKFKDSFTKLFLPMNFFFPIIIFIICLIFWKRYGKDPKINKTIIPEFEIPENLSPVQMGMLISNGTFKNNFISASIINMAVRGFLSIEEIREKILFMPNKDFKLKKLKSTEGASNIDKTETLTLGGIFEDKDEILLSSLKNKFYKKIPEIKKSAKDTLIEKELITKKGLSLQIIFMVIGFILFAFSFVFISVLPGLVACGPIIFIFSLFMPKRTQKGAELLWRVKGFKLYMETAEKYRQQFNEKENIFELYLPYAMIFGITKLWAKKMQEIYGEEYFQNYHPVWFIGLNVASFDPDSFTSELNNISSSVSSHMGGSSGAGGGGFAGGGGGGGGGGGW